MGQQATKRWKGYDGWIVEGNRNGCDGTLVWDSTLSNSKVIGGLNMQQTLHNTLTFTQPKPSYDLSAFSTSLAGLEGEWVGGFAWPTLVGWVFDRCRASTHMRILPQNHLN